MNTIITTLTTEAVFSKDGIKRYLLHKTWDEKKQKLSVIMLAPSKASGIELVYAAGVGKAKSKVFQDLQRNVLERLRPFEGKLNCLCNASGSSRLQHPLSPAVRAWHLSPLKVSELIDDAPVTEPEQKKKPKGK